MKTFKIVVLIILPVLLFVLLVGCRNTQDGTNTPADQTTTTQTVLTDLSAELENCENLGVLNDLMFNIALKAVYKQEGKEDLVHSIGISVCEAFNGLLDSNRDKEPVTRTNKTGESLQFDATIGNQSCKVFLCNDGFLYIKHGIVEKAFEIGQDEYDNFMKKFYAGSCVWTDEQPITVG